MPYLDSTPCLYRLELDRAERAFGTDSDECVERHAHLNAQRLAFASKAALRAAEGEGNSHDA